MSDVYDVLILGGGPAGLAAGVYMGRYLRKTLILNHKKPQTRWHRPIAHNVLGFPSGIHRNQLLDWGRAHVAKYECVGIVEATIQRIDQHQGLFRLRDEEGREFFGKGLILAPGVENLLPDIPGIFDYAGHTIWHCPECDGYKCHGKKITVMGTGRGTAEMALNVMVWSDSITICTHGREAGFDQECIDKLRAANIPVETQAIRRILGVPEEGAITGFELADGRVIEAEGAFANEGCDTPDELVSQLPLELERGRWVRVDHRMRTNIPRCYAAGDIVADVQTQLSVAMGTGATAAIWLHKELLPANQCLSGRIW